MKIKLLCAAFFSVLTTQAIAASNPASVDYVNNAITAYKNTLVNLSIGDFYQGGVVIYLDATKQHGLTAAIKDQVGGAIWSCVTVDGTSAGACLDLSNTPQFITGAISTGVGGGSINTPVIAAAQSAEVDGAFVGNYAARRAMLWEVLSDGLTQCNGEVSDPVPDCYGAWYLPAASELQLMMQYRDLVNETSISHGGTAIPENTNYWSSTEVFTNTAWMVNSSTGLASAVLKTGNRAVRAVRAF